MSDFNFSNRRRRCSLSFSKPSMTKQEFLRESRISTIIDRCRKTGYDPTSDFNSYGGSFADVSVVPDYKDTLNAYASAEQAFFSLPSKLRARFDNNPRDYLDFCLNPANRDEMVSLGLLKPVSAFADNSAAPTASSSADASQISSE